MGHPPGEGGGDVAALDLYGRVAELEARARPFALATVVAVRRPTSARPGAHGLVHPDGAIEGWVGGSCAQPVVVREALRSLVDGQPRLLRLSREAPADSRRGDGVIEYVMTCHSGGTLEIYVEPHLPAPHLWVVGLTPIASALAALGAASGFRVSVVDPLAQAEQFPAAERVVGSDDLAGLDPEVVPYVVVASQGQWDEEALAAVLGREVRYVGLVASPVRAAAVREWLRDEGGVPDERLAALRAPAGLDLGAETPEEVAISILAELVQVRRNRAPFVAAPGPATVAGTPGATAASSTAPAPSAAPTGPDGMVLLDPVCGMTVEPHRVRHIAEQAGIVYAFCSVGCRSRFMRDPTAYVSAEPAAQPQEEAAS
ncbi:MAG TPA: XdhC family protein [Candidatus Limnocylindrales bacterium]|nr:XdhC family protein [Candidatus Limnocylindrales bacterium]